MVLKNFVKSQLVEVIEWVDDSTDTLVYHFPVAGQEIKMGAQLTVREGQLAVFVNEGRIADTFEPGGHRLSRKTSGGRPRHGVLCEMLAADPRRRAVLPALRDAPRLDVRQVSDEASRRSKVLPQLRLAAELDLQQV